MKTARAAVALAVGCFAIVASAPAVSAALRPSVHLSTTVTSTGQRVLVQGTGWTSVEQVRISLCGNLALDGSADCDLPNSVDAGVGSNGVFSMSLAIERPPTPCPCVVRVINAQGAIPQAGARIEITDVPRAVARSRVPDVGVLLKVEEAHIDGSGPWQSWFGGSAQRTLVVTMHNVGTVMLTDPKLSIAMGKGSTPTQYVPAPPVRQLRPGERRVVRIPLELDALSWGEFNVVGQVIGYGPSADFRASTSTGWWGWMVVAFVLFNILLWSWLFRRTRRRPTTVVTADDLAFETAPSAVPEPTENGTAAPVG